MPSFAIEFLFFVVGVLVLVIGLFFTAFPGRDFIQAKLAVNKLKNELEPLARALEAETKVEWDSDKRAMLYFFEFPKEALVDVGCHGNPHSIPQWVTLTVSKYGFNIYTPSFNPPLPESERINLLLKTIHRLNLISKSNN